MGRPVIPVPEGAVFGRLTVIGRAPNIDNTGAWLCRCSCGNHKAIKGYQLRNGAVVSCGCQHREAAARNMRKAHVGAPTNLQHGEARAGSETPEWKIWQSLQSRPGGVDPRWQSFEAFLADAGRRPREGLFLCRRDTGQPFGPANFVWETARWRAQNRKKATTAKQSVIFLECKGERLALSDWSDRSGVGVPTIRSRIKNGWGAEEAIFARASVSDGLKRTWKAGRISPRKPVYTKEERRHRLRAAQRARYQADPQAWLKKLREWYRKNPGRKKAISDRYTERNRDKLNAKSRDDRLTPQKKEYMRVYAKSHRAKNKAIYLSYSHNRRAKYIGAGGVHTAEEWAALLAEYNGCCAYCGDSMVRMTRDHRIPLIRGGSNHISNILPACGTCNSAKNALTEDEFRRRLSGESISFRRRRRTAC